MEADVSAIENIVKRQTSPKDVGSSNSQDKPLATDEDVLDAEVLVNDSGKVGGIIYIMLLIHWLKI